MSFISDRTDLKLHMAMPNRISNFMKKYTMTLKNTNISIKEQYLCETEGTKVMYTLQ